MAAKHRKKALITGITGQDGSYISELFNLKTLVLCKIFLIYHSFI